MLSGHNRPILGLAIGLVVLGSVGLLPDLDLCLVSRLVKEGFGLWTWDSANKPMPTAVLTTYTVSIQTPDSLKAQQLLPLVLK